MWKLLRSHLFRGVNRLPPGPGSEWDIAGGTAATGIRRGELLALKWDDVDYERLELNVTRSIVHHVIGTCKTKTSRKPVPLDALVADVLRQWQRSTPYSTPQDWIFASPLMNNRQHYWPEPLMKRHISRQRAERESPSALDGTRSATAFPRY
jgi:integrase